jgi:hypothetical protein
MPESSKDGPIAPRRTLGGPILPPPPPEIAEQAEQAEQAKAEAARKQALKEAQQASREERLAERDAEKSRKAEERAREKARQQAAKEQQKAARSRPATREAAPAPAARPAAAASSPTPAAPAPAPSGRGAPRRSRRAQLRLVQIDAWSVMKTAFLLSIALGIVLVVAVAIIWGVLGAAGVWDSINSIVQQAVGSDTGTPFQIQEYVGTSRVLGFTMIVAVIDVILITAIATLGAFLYNLAAALLGGIEVTLAEDS